MYLTITSTRPPATDLGYLLHKHPGRAQSLDLPVGRAHVFYPEATAESCTAALLLEVDPIDVVRGRKASTGGTSLARYINDRPYAASSMMAVALGRVFRTAMSGRCEHRPDLVNVELPLRIGIPALPTGVRAGQPGDDKMLRRFFEPLGWTVDASVLPLDPKLPSWGASTYSAVTLTATITLANALSQLYVLLPVLDGAKHYWVGSDEVDKLVRAGGSWLAGHPERELIARRYLAHQSDLLLTAVGRLTELDQSSPEVLDNAVDFDAVDFDAVDFDGVESDISGGFELAVEPAVQAGGIGPQPTLAERPPSLGRLRATAVVAELRAAGCARVIDLGCGEGALLRVLLRDPSFTEVLGTDVSARALGLAERRLGLDRMPDSQRSRLRLLQSSLVYRDQRVAGFDGAVLMEVIEHLDPDRLPSLERNVFGSARPRVLLVTTPNAEYNSRYERLADGEMRHRDHRFEWTRGQFAEWADAVAAEYGYQLRFSGVGDFDPELGAPTQMAIFSRSDASPVVSTATGQVLR
ncbi:MAG: 3' terminal RNA ribose 2'-O-methyltransferase Hen1 [Nakamurella sp.]